MYDQQINENAFILRCDGSADPGISANRLQQLGSNSVVKTKEEGVSALDTYGQNQQSAIRNGVSDRTEVLEFLDSHQKAVWKS
jgi:hypothetical protein